MGILGNSFKNFLIFFSVLLLLLGIIISFIGIHFHRFFLISLYFILIISTSFRWFEVLRNASVVILEFVSLKSVSDVGPSFLLILTLLLFIIFFIIALSVVIPQFFAKRDIPPNGVRGFQDRCIDLASQIPSRWTLFALYFSGICIFFYFYFGLLLLLLLLLLQLLLASILQIWSQAAPTQEIGVSVPFIPSNQFLDRIFSFVSTIFSLGLFNPYLFGVLIAIASIVREICQHLFVYLYYIIFV
jgi:hypothetical protein